MNCFVDIKCHSEISADVYLKLLSELSQFMNDSNLIPGSNIEGIRAEINPSEDLISNAQQINTKLYWIAYNKDLRVNEMIFCNFKLRCLHLSALKSSLINKILLVIVPTINSLASDKNKEQESPKEENESNLIFEAVTPKYQLDKVLLNEENRRQIKRAISLVNSRKKIFEDWGFSEIDPHTKTILCFYGPPGTGKTMCAHAMANVLGKKIIIASYATIESKWVGEGPKNLKKIFKDAEAQDALLFFDEADSFLSRRIDSAETGSDKHYNRMTNEMFQLLEDYNGIVVFATNLVKDFDKAFKSRILSFVEFEKPDQETRIKLIKLLIPTKVPMTSPMTVEEFSKLSALSDGFSGREVRKAILTTLAHAVENEIEKLSYKEFEVGFASVKEEIKSIERSMEGESNRYIHEFIMENETNNYIMDVCLKALWQADEIVDSQKKYIYQLSKILNLSMPDLSISYKNKDIEDAINDITKNGRQKECLKYIGEIFSISNMYNDRMSRFIDSISESFDIDNGEIKQYINILTILNDKKNA